MDIPDSSEKGLIKTFLTGAALPVVWVGCLATRRPKPRWLTQELCYTGKAARDLSFVFGIVCGVSGILKVETSLMDHFLLSEKTTIVTPTPTPAPKPPPIPMPRPSLLYGGPIIDGGEYRVRTIPYTIPKPDPAEPARKLII